MWGCGQMQSSRATQSYALLVVVSARVRHDTSTQARAPIKQTRGIHTKVPHTDASALRGWSDVVIPHNYSLLEQDRSGIYPE